VRAGKRTYFFDVRSGPKGGLYLSLSETAVKEDGGFTRSRMLVLEQHTREFYEGLCEAIRSIRDAQKTKDAEKAAQPVPPKVGARKAKVA
jgi:hypothetical protein